MWDHIFKKPPNMKGLVLPIDKPHADRLQELSTGVEPKVGRCFCGGTVTTVRAGSDGWSTDCNDCQIMYDED